MSDNENEIIDLGYDVAKDDVQKPLIRKCVVRAKCTKTYTQEKEASDGSGTVNKFLMVQWETLEPVTDTTGKVQPPGFNFYPQRVMMNPSGKLTPEMIRQKMQTIHFALAGEGRVNTGAWVGKEALITVALREPREDKATGKHYDASNEIDRVNPVKK